MLPARENFRSSELARVITRTLSQSDEEIIMSHTTQEKNKALVLEAFDTLFNKRDYAAAEKYWSPNYIQHSAHIEPGRDGLFNLIRSAPDALRYEHQFDYPEGDFVIIHGRFSGNGRPVAWIAADILRIENGLLASTGMSYKMKRPKPNPKAACRCLEQFSVSKETSHVLQHIDFVNSQSSKRLR